MIHSNQAGFTLVESLLVLVILGILSIIAVPSFQQMLASHRAKTQLQSLFHHIMLAKSKALESQSVISVCPKGPELTCGKNWQSGWFVFQDEDASGSRDDNEPLIQESSDIHPSDTLQWRGFRRRAVLQFGPDGYLKDLTAGSFHYCARTHQEKWVKRALVLNVYGRARFSSDVNGDGIHEIRHGAPIHCG